MGIKLSNNASSRLAANLSVSDTSVVLASGGGAVFPSLAAGDWFPATIVKMTGEFEIVKVTARSGDTLTVQRGQENTAATTFLSGDRIELCMTAGALQAMLAEKIDKTGNSSITGYLGVSGALSAGSMSAPSARFPTLNGGTTIIYSNGGGGGAGSYYNQAAAGANGTASGGDTNTTGGGSAGGTGGTYGTTKGGNGGKGGRAVRTFSYGENGNVAKGIPLTIVVGNGGAGGAGQVNGTAGTDGAVYISWT